MRRELMAETLKGRRVYLSAEVQASLIRCYSSAQIWERTAFDYSTRPRRLRADHPFEDLVVIYNWFTFGPRRRVDDLLAATLFACGFKSDEVNRLVAGLEPEEE